MTESLRQKAQSDPGSLSFDEFQSLLSSSGWTRVSGGSPKSVWRSPQGVFVSVQDFNGKAVGHQVKIFLNAEAASY